MAAPPLIALNEARLKLGGETLFSGVELALGAGDRVCLVGRNGSGKSSLLKVLAGEIELDAGRRVLKPGARVGRLPQDPDFSGFTTLEAVVAAGLTAEGGAHKVTELLARFDLKAGRAPSSLSGGEARRLALARTLVAEPDILLLDEPTNHLDLPTIEWLEQELAGHRGAILVVSHDRRFLERVSKTTLWLDRGRLRRLDKGFAHFEDWAEACREEEARRLSRLGKKIEQEERWLARGVTARRRRNQGRLAKLQSMRESRARWLREPGSPKLALAESERGSDLVIEAEGLSKSFGGHSIITGFSTRIRRGERIGVVGPNGAGKTTLVRLLIGGLEPDAGRLRLAANLQSVYFDQGRESLDPEASLWQSLAPDGGDSLMVGGRQRHVVAYLRHFLFRDVQARQPVKALSGGEKARLLLARLFAKPSNLLVLDEPTNDLDLETLDLLTEVIDDYAGSVILVSHDRDFLDRLVGSVIWVEGDGRVEEFVGGYSEAARQHAKLAVARERPARDASQPSAPRRTKARQEPAKLGYKEQRELEELPDRIASLTAAIETLRRTLADPELYRRDRATYERASAGLGKAESALEAAEARWLQLEERRETLERARQEDG
jgi:ATP-binding cassette subfamily F protein uup